VGTTALRAGAIKAKMRSSSGCAGCAGWAQLAAHNSLDVCRWAAAGVNHCIATEGCLLQQAREVVMFYGCRARQGCIFAGSCMYPGLIV